MASKHEILSSTMNDRGIVRETRFSTTADIKEEILVWRRGDQVVLVKRDNGLDATIHLSLADAIHIGNLMLKAALAREAEITSPS